MTSNVLGKCPLPCLIVPIYYISRRQCSIFQINVSLIPGSHAQEVGKGSGGTGVSSFSCTPSCDHTWLGQYISIYVISEVIELRISANVPRPFPHIRGYGEVWKRDYTNVFNFILGHSKSISSFSSPFSPTCILWLGGQYQSTLPPFLWAISTIFSIRNYTYWQPLPPPVRINFELRGDEKTINWFGGALVSWARPL